MKKAIKNFALIMMMILSLSFVLTGCSLFEKNLAKYYNTVVVAVEYQDGDKIEITKKELITAFNNYGANLVSNSGYTVEDALNQTITALINQKVLIKTSEGLVEYSNLDKNNLWDDTYKALQTNVETFITEVKEDWEISTPTSEEAEEDKVVAYTPFEPTVTLEYENGQYVIKLTEEQEDEDVALKFSDMSNIENKDVIVANLYNAIMANTVFTSTNETLTELEIIERQNARVYEEAINRYIKTLLSNEEGLKLSVDLESVFEREIKRIYENKLDSLKITKMQEIITKTTTYSKVTVQDVLDKYNDMLKETILKYALNATQFDTDVLSSFSSINYSENEDYFFVSHILLKFSDEQQEEYNSLSDNFNSGKISALEYQERLTQLTNQIIAVERDADGKIISSSNKNAQTVLNELTTALTNAENNALAETRFLSETEQQKAVKEAKALAFRTIMYKYNQDDGALNAEYLYVVGTENSQMVEPFTNSARKLYNEGNGEFGSISGLVQSEYGVHIVFYAGPITQAFPIKVNSIDNVVLNTSDVQVLADTLLNPLNNKTLFDKVFASITAQTSSQDETMYINNLKKDLKITKYVSRYKDLL